MSPLAGPVAAAAVVFAPGSRIPGVDDSKKLDAATRERLAMEIKESALTWSVGFAEVAEIDCINIYWAGMLAPWLGQRMATLGAIVCQAIVHHCGRDEFLRRNYQRDRGLEMRWQHEFPYAARGS